MSSEFHPRRSIAIAIASSSAIASE
jgi:hypothetical protein